MTPGIWSTPPTTASTARIAIATFIGALALGDVVLGPGIADVGVLRLARHRVDRLGVVEVAALELARLLVRLAAEDPEHHPERIERGHQRRQRPGRVEDPVAAAALRREREDLVLGEVAGEARERRQRERRDQEQRRT